MSTPSDIIVQLKNGKWARIYCHYDGYISHNGVILQKYYNSQAKAEKLVSLGDLSSLDSKCSKPKGHSFENKIKGYCVAYGRDRGETGVEAQISNTLIETVYHNSLNEYTYIFSEGTWKVCKRNYKKSIPLQDAVNEEKEAEKVRAINVGL